MSLAAAGRLFAVDLDKISIKAEKLHDGLVDHLIILVPQKTDLNETFNTTVTSWVEAFQYAQAESINFIFITLGDLLCGKLGGYR